MFKSLCYVFRLYSKHPPPAWSFPLQCKIHCYCFIIVSIRIIKSCSHTQTCKDRRQQGEEAEDKPFSPLQPCIFQLVGLSHCSFRGCQMPGSLADTGGLISMLHLCFLQRHHWCQYLPRVSIHTVGAGSNKSKASGLCSSSWVHTRWHLCNVSAFGQFSCPF